MAEIYLSGPVTGHGDFNRQKFGEVRDAIIGRKIIKPDTAVIIPHDIVPSSSDHDEAMRICLPHIIDCSSVVIMLPGWEFSEGASLERQVALACGIPVVEVSV